LEVVGNVPLGSPNEDTISLNPIEMSDPVKRS
jgi:hypothetical protein